MVKRTDKPRTVQPAASGAPSCGAEHACGACQQLNVPYETQLAEKTERIRELVAASGFDPAIVQPILGMDEPYRYRNKVISPFVPGRKLPAKSGAKQKNTPRSAEMQADLQRRLNRAIGQLNGIKAMVDTNRYCGDVLVQLSATRSAIQSIERIVLQNHLETCVVEEIRAGNDEVVQEAMDLIRRVAR